MKKYSENSIKKLKNVRYFIIDMDGTIYLGEKILPDTIKFLEFLGKRKIDYIFLTNNSSKSAKHYREKLKRMGIFVNEDKIFTSGEATIIFLKNKKKFKRLYLLGTASLKEEFRSAGFSITSKNPQCVVLGFDTTLNYNKLKIFCDFVQKGLPYIATHSDKLCPTENGFIPDAGAIIAFVHEVTKRNPDSIIGKPSKTILKILMEKIKIKPEKIAFIGDRLYTDIVAGKKLKILTILTLTGETKIKDLESSTIKPDIIIENLNELIELMN